MINLENYLVHRKTTKIYKTGEKLPMDKVKQLFEVIRMSPSSIGLESWRVVVSHIDNKEERAGILPLMMGQMPVQSGEYVLLFISKTFESYDNGKSKWYRSYAAAFEKRTGRDPSIVDQFIPTTEHEFNAWVAKQTYLALGTALTTAAMLGMDSTPMEGFDQTKLTKHLQDTNVIDKDEIVTVAMALGVNAHSKDNPYLPVMRKPMEEVFSCITKKK